MGRLNLLRRSLAQDARIARRHLFVNVLAGSALIPRALRLLLYRIAGIRAVRANILPGSRFTGNDVAIGPGTFINHGCYFDVGGRGRLRIGSNCNLGPLVTILGMTHDIYGDGSYSRKSEPSPVVIGDQVWIGARSLILPGVTVKDGTIVAAGSVVTKDIGPGGVWGGVPARLIRGAEREHFV